MTKKWLTFNEVYDTGKTKIWEIYNAENDSFLGEVKWNGGWRQYVFEAEGHCIWNPDCLDQLTAFIRQQMELRKKPKVEDHANDHTDVQSATDYRIETEELDVKK